MTARHCSIGFAILALLASTCAYAQDNDAYKGKTVRIVEGYSAGSTYDNYARLVAREIGRFLPGEPSVVVDYMPGVSGLKAAQYLDNGAPKDGTVIAEVASDMVLEALFKPDEISTKFTNLTWLGSIDEDAQVCYMWHATGIEDWHQLVAKKPVVMGSTGPGVPSYVDSQMLKVFLGADIKQVRGYPGSPEKRVAIEKGELDGDCTSWPGVPRDWLRDHKINLILRMAGSPAEGMPASLPSLADILTDPQQRQVFELLSMPNSIGRPFLASASIPSDRREMLLHAFDSMVKDSKFLADAASMGLTVKPMRGADVSQRVMEMNRASPDLLARAKAITE